MKYPILRTISSHHKSIAHRIILAHKTPDTIKQILVLVEGEDDKAVYQQFFKDGAVDIKDCSGCEVVASVHNVVKDETKWRYLSILDSDFKRLKRLPNHDSNMFYTDYHDSEVLMIMSDSVIKSVMNKVLGSIPGYNLRDRLFKELYYVSLLKWFNMYRHFGYAFKDLDLSHEAWGKQITEARVIQHMVPSKISPKIFPGKLYNNFKAQNPNPDLEQITNGHDCVSRWAAILKNDHKRQYSDGEFRDIICASFTTKCATKTNLYKEIDSWARANSLNIIAI